MTETAVQFQPLSRLSLAELTRLWDRAYEDYFVPLHLNEAQLAGHIERSDIDLDRSLLGLVDGEPFGLSCAGVRGARAWIGGFGVARERRRQGLALQLMQAHLARLGDMEEVSLEVISQNPARELYRKCGFNERGARLLLLAGAPQIGDGPELVRLDAEAAMGAKAALPPRRQTWRREPASVRRDLAGAASAFAVLDGARPLAFAVAVERPELVMMLDAGAADPAAAAALVAAMARAWPGQTVRLGDEPEGSPMAVALQAAGLQVGLTQVEMVRPR